jgi:adenylate kinase
MFNPPEKDGICNACGADLYQRDDDKEEVIRQRLAVYNEKTKPLINYYDDAGILVNIDGTGVVDAVFADICKVMNQFK